jgi:hypothetical protein
MLWGRAANRCAFANCHRELVMNETETDDASLIGDECHIVARELEGPRGKSELSSEARDKYDNLLLLCKIHHKIIDDQSTFYSIPVLKKMKQEHEAWVRESLSLDETRQHDDEIYMTYIDKWEELLDINEWKSWSSFILGGGQPSLSVAQDSKLNELRAWLLGRIWSGRYPEIEAAITNFRLVLEDFYNVFHEHAERQGYGNDMFATRKFYKIQEWDKIYYNKLSAEYDYHVDLVQDLMLELTRAANYVCDNVRRFIMPSYRLATGVILVTSGPHMDFKYHTYRVEYREEERTLIPYPGLNQFKKIRINRDRSFCSDDNN